MDFQEVDRRYAELKRQHAHGTLSTEGFDTKVQQMMVQDDDGRLPRLAAGRIEQPASTVADPIAWSGLRGDRGHRGNGRRPAQLDRVVR